MNADNAAATTRIQVMVGEDALQAWLELPEVSNPDVGAPTEEEVLAALNDQKIHLTDSVRQRVAEFLALVGESADEEDGAAEGPREWPQRYLVAQGRAPNEAVDSQFEWAEEHSRSAEDWQGDAPVNYYTLNAIITLDAGTTIGRVTEAVDGVDGVDVRGVELRPKRRKSRPLSLGNGLRFSKEHPNVVVTDVAGRVVQEGEKLWIDEVLTIAGDIDFKSGNVDAVIDVHIRGNVNPKFQVQSKKSVVVEQAVEAATVTAGEDINIRRGIFGQDAGRKVVAGGSITTRICDAATIEADGDVCVGKEIINCRIRSRGTLRIGHGSIIGGEVWAREGVTIKTVGNDVGVATRIAAGIDGAVLYANMLRERKIRKSLARAEQVREQIKPLIANMKRLTAAQREMATELMSKADGVEMSAEGLKTECAETLAQAKPEGTPAIEITGTIYPGVCVVFGLREAAIQHALKGPLRIEERKIDGATEIAVINPLTGSLTALPSVQVDEKRFKQTDTGKDETSDGE